MTHDEKDTTVSRRQFMQTSAAATAAFVLPVGAYAAGSDVIRVGLIGCGGRGTGAARDCLRSSEGVELVALGDLVPDRLAQCRAELAKAAAGDAKETSFPSSSMRPSSGATTPAIILMSVDLPAPFSPSTAWIAPGRTAILASFSAIAPP